MTNTQNELKCVVVLFFDGPNTNLAKGPSTRVRFCVRFRARFAYRELRVSIVLQTSDLRERLLHSHMGSGATN
jgi:hypothetical protein